ncbi:hypothetical protein [Thermogutta sp.]|uniref:hypothetical protein n=1 Tax=Thermogutta sp. TaxID=1962930 RepID=UPI0032209542
MNVAGFFWQFLGIPQAEQVESVDLYWGASWVRAPWLLLGLAIIVVTVGVAAYYGRWQYVPSRRLRMTLVVIRTLALAALVGILLQPTLVVKLQRLNRPGLWFVIDDTESMSLVDRGSEPGENALGVAPSSGGRRLLPPAGNSEGQLTRSERVRQTFAALDPELVGQVENAFRVRVFRLHRGDGVDPLTVNLEDLARQEQWTSQFTADGPVTALGAALLDLNRKRGATPPGAIVLVSDFNHNAGIAPETVAAQLQTPLYCVGVGDVQTHDLAVDVQLPPMMKKDEKSVVTVAVRQEGFTGQEVTLRVFARQAEDNQSPSAVSSAASSSVGNEESISPHLPTSAAATEPKMNDPVGEVILQEVIRLSGPVVHREVPYVPKAAGQLVITAEVDRLPQETLTENNRIVRDTYVREYYVRVLFIEDEPSWEWRFIKEVFHRDPLVGPEGFRTYLRSADARVRVENPLFLPTLALPRRDFFTYDVVIIGDIPASAISRSMMEMIREFVTELGGGVVFSVGPRFSPGQWADTPLNDLLPVEIAPLTRLRESSFHPQRTPEADLFDFMVLGPNAEENGRAWDNLGKVVWYYPVVRVRPLATVLLAHPRDTCADGRTPQPLIAAQKVGRGEVIYVGFNELWRLRRKYGDLYYRQFWGQLIHRLAIQHALGADKRFVARSDRKQYRSGDEVRFSVEAYNADYRPLTEDQIPGGQLEAFLHLPAGTGGQTRKIPLTLLRPGQFEGRTTVFAPGEYRLEVHDPLTNRIVETSFKVSSQSIEKQQARRNRELQDRLASLTGGQSYDLPQLAELLRNLPQRREKETEIVQVELWNTWLFFGLVVGALLVEWALRKWLYLR